MTDSSLDISNNLSLQNGGAEKARIASDGTITATNLSGTNTGDVSADTTTIQNTNKVLTTIGVKTKSGSIKYDWIGTSVAYNTGRGAGLIPDTWVCYIIDDTVSNNIDYATESYTIAMSIAMGG